MILDCTSTTLTDTEGMLDSTICFFYGQAPRTELFRVTSSAWRRAGGHRCNCLHPPPARPDEGDAERPAPLSGSTRPFPRRSKDIANSNLLGVTTHAQTFVWKSLAQTEESDLAMCGSSPTASVGCLLPLRRAALLGPLQAVHRAGALRHAAASQDQDFDLTAERRMIEFTPRKRRRRTPRTWARRSPTSLTTSRSRSSRREVFTPSTSS